MPCVIDKTCGSLTYGLVVIVEESVLVCGAVGVTVIVEGLCTFNGLIIAHKLALTHSMEFGPPVLC